tara:strand:- start:194 stop:457 length:264 start_codon:yes stop_codon:yes gene_type:complete
MIKKFKNKIFERLIFFFVGLSIGIIIIWPDIIRNDSRICFTNIIKDGSDGNVKISTIFSINPNYLLKINNTKNQYKKILLIGDFCFR